VLFCAVARVSVQKQKRRQVLVQSNTNNVMGAAAAIDSRGPQLLLLLTAKESWCFHSEDEDADDELVAHAAAGAGAAASMTGVSSNSGSGSSRPNSRRQVATRIRTRVHAFRSVLADRLLALVGSYPPSDHAVGTHRITASRAATLFYTAHFAPLVRQEKLKEIAKSKIRDPMQQQQTVRSHTVARTHKHQCAVLLLSQASSVCCL